MKFGRNVLQENTHQITPVDGVGFSIWIHVLNVAAVTSFHVRKVLPPGVVNKHEASAARLCNSVRQFLIYSTFVFRRPTCLEV